MATTPQPSFWQNLGTSASELLSDPNFQQLLMGIGTQMDPQGAGGIIGRAGMAYSRNKQYQNLAAKQLAGAEADRKELREMNRRLLERMGPITPSGTEGLNGAKETRSGALELDIDTGDPYKLAADLGGMTSVGSPGVNSITRSKTGSYIFNVDAPNIPAPMSVADQLDDFSEGNLYQNGRIDQPLSYTPVNQDARIAEMADLMETSMPPGMLASMRSPTVPQIQYASNPSQQRADMNELLSQDQIAQVEPPNSENLLPRRLLRQRRR